MKLLKLKGVVCLLLVMFSVQLTAQEKKNITGTLTDGKTGAPLPFATVNLVKSLRGTVTNEKGKFEMIVPEGAESDTLVARFLGYEDKKIPLSKINDHIDLKLQSSAYSLTEVVIRPKPPTYYIKLAVSKIKENYPDQPFTTRAYYGEKLTENGHFVKHNEGVFQTYYPSFQDTVKNQNQLMLLRVEEKTREIAFMKRQREKEAKKERKKAEKKGKEYKEEDLFDAEELFGGPNDILDASRIEGEGDVFLDSNNFKKINYTFGPGTTYQGKKIMVINFKTRRKVDHVKMEGTIYIDEESDAIVAMNYKGVFKIPLAIKPILFLFGVSIENPKFEVNKKYREIKGRWYPSDIQWGIDLNVTKRYLFRKNEQGNFNISQVFVVNDFNLDTPKEIEEKKMFDPKKGFKKEQEFNDLSLKWSEVNTVKR